MCITATYTKAKKCTGPSARPVSDDHDTSYHAGIGLVSLPKLKKVHIGYAWGDSFDTFYAGMAAGARQSQVIYDNTLFVAHIIAIKI